LQIRGFEFCLVVVGPTGVRSHLSKGMRIAALRHTAIAKELVALRPTVSCVTEFALGRSPNDTFRVKVVDELIVKFRKQEEWWSHLERPGARLCDLILGPPSGRARLANQLEEATGQLGVEQDVR
jgi:hypothetical protein